MSDDLEAIVQRAASGCSATVSSRTPPQAGGSRRRRLWELKADSHCAIVGVCLPVAELRRLMDKTFGGRSQFDDYHLHVGAVSQCAGRNKVSQTLQHELDRRFAAALRRFAAAKTADAVAAAWVEAVRRDEFAAGLWAGLTHPRCDAALHDRICRDIHMIQHELAAAVRAEAGRLDALSNENKVLARELARVQERATQWHEERRDEREQLNAELLRLRAEAAAKDALIGSLRDAAAGDEFGAGAASHEALRERVAELKQRLVQARQTLAEQRGEIERLQSERDASTAAVRALELPVLAPEAAAPARALDAAAANLQARSVLCVGGRSGHIPLYRDLVERHGGRFLHHDGGLEDNAHRLDAHLAAADLVICQTGCLSHNAYWRVKDHCKRTGKPCVYLEKPGAVSFLRSLEQVPTLEAPPCT